jgi:membrane associated rhomboid family serine protease
LIPISDDNPTFRTPWMTLALLAVTIAVWIAQQGAGLDAGVLAASVCNYGLVPAELTGLKPVGYQVPMGGQWVCEVDNYAINWLTPITSIFLHGSWAHLLGNCLYLWVFGNNVEDSMGRGRFLGFYLLCGVLAAAAQMVVDPGSPIPMVGASGAISGTLGGYLVLHPHAHVKTLIPILIFPWIVSVRAWVILIFWFLWQVLSGLPQLMSLRSEVSGGVAVWAHIGGFVAGVLLVRLFRNPSLSPVGVPTARSPWGVT